MYNYYVIEIQTHSDGTSGNLVYGFEAKDTAEDKFCQCRESANDSTVACHTVLFIDKEGRHMDKESPKCYHHNEPVPGEEE